MSTSFKAGLAAAIAAALLGAPAISTAAHAPAELAAAGVPVFGTLAPIASAAAPLNAAQTQSQLASGLLAQTVAQTVAQTTETTSLFATDADDMKVARSAATLRALPSDYLSGGSELLLWNLVAMVRAHQAHHSFELVNAGINTVLISEDVANVSAVPLPGAIWLFVMGVMGLAGTRITGVARGVSHAKVKHDASHRFGAAVPV